MIDIITTTTGIITIMTGYLRDTPTIGTTHLTVAGITIPLTLTVPTLTTLTTITTGITLRHIPIMHILGVQ